MLNLTYRKLAIFVFIIINFTTYSCTTRTHTKTITPISTSDRSGIKKIAIYVQLDEELNVNLSNLKNRYWVSMLQNPPQPGSGIGAAALLILVPVIITVTAVIEESVRGGMDHAKEKEFREDLSNLNLTKLLSQNIDKSFESSNAGFEAGIIESKDPKILAQKGYDSILDITLKNIEVNLCPKRFVYGYTSPEEEKQGIGPYSLEEDEIEELIMKWNSIYLQHILIRQKIPPDAVITLLYSPDAINKSKEEIDESEKLNEKLEALKKSLAKLRPIVAEYDSSDQIRIWITFYGKIITARESKLIWEREEVYYDPKCERVKDLQSNPEIIIDMVSRSISNLAANTVVQILY